METKELDLVQLIRQLRDYVILDRKDYEKLVQNSKPVECNESALEARDAQITLLQRQLARQEEHTRLDRVGDIIGPGYTPGIEPDKEEHNLSETEKYF